MRLRDLLDTLGATPNHECLLKRALQVFDFFRQHGYSADDIHMAHDTHQRMGMALKIQGEVITSIFCGTYDGTQEDWERVWLGFAENLTQLNYDEVREWCFADGVLNTSKLTATLVRDGVFPVGAGSPHAQPN